MNIYVKYFCLLFTAFFSLDSFAYESYLFPLTTQINLADLYDYTVNVELSDVFIVLDYNDKKEIFNNGFFRSYVETNIPMSSGDSFTYSYNISEFTSKCVVHDSGDVLYNDFVDLYIDKIHYDDVTNIPDFLFDNDVNTGYKNSTNKFELVTNQNIASDRPLNCNGRITFNVELRL